MKIKDAAVAAEEFDDALTYYRDVHPYIAETLFNEVSRAKKLIVQFPYAWKNYGGGLVVVRLVAFRFGDQRQRPPYLQLSDTALHGRE